MARLNDVTMHLDGVTPLMVASVRGGGVETGISDDESAESGDGAGGVEGSDSMIAGLLLQGASLSAQTDRTGLPYQYFMTSLSRLYTLYLS